jgi:choline dehydrogenase-like flavoprotein
MPIADLRTIPENESLTADVCIIGSGPAGATTALELANSPLKVVVLESGGTERTPEADLLNEVENVGRPRIMDQWLVRNRLLGGTSNTWAGRCTGFDEIDYEIRNWVPAAGWPVSIQDLEPYLVRSESYLGLLGSGGFESSKFRGILRTGLAKSGFREDLFLPAFWQVSRSGAKRGSAVNFGQLLRSGRASNVSILLNATATRLNTDEFGNKIESVDVKTPEGNSRRISATCVVLCAGGIENARLLLASNHVVRSGLGNQKDLVGRYLMDHLKGTVISFHSRHAAAVEQRFPQYLLKSKNGYHRVLQGVRLSPVVQRKQGLLNCAVFLEESELVADDDPYAAIKKIARREGSPASHGMSIVSNAGLVGRGLFGYLAYKRAFPRKQKRLELRCIVEQRPSPESRVMLSNQVDRYGIPLPKIDWRVSEQEVQTIRATAKCLDQELGRLYIGKRTVEPWIEQDQGLPPHFLDIAHPIGTTRMSNSRDSGVIDESCEVYGTRGLFVAGSSVFPTSGHANPTQMIVALAIRLAETLKNRSER